MRAFVIVPRAVPIVRVLRTQHGSWVLSVVKTSALVVGARTEDLVKGKADLVGVAAWRSLCAGVLDRAGRSMRACRHCAEDLMVERQQGITDVGTTSMVESTG